MIVFRHILYLIVILLLAQPSAYAREKQKTNVDWLTSIILSEPKLPSATTLKAALDSELDRRSSIRSVETSENTIVLQLRTGSVTIMLMDRPIPNSELKRTCKRAWDWRNACETVGPHKAHLIVSTMQTGLSKIDSALLHTKVVAALLDDSNALASYWGVNLRERSEFLKQAKGADRKNLPVTLWVSILVTRDSPEKWSASTRGMGEFGLREIESKESRIDGRNFYRYVIGLSMYLIEKGAIIKDGETFGESPKQNIRVRLAPSYWNEGQDVYRLVFPD